MLPTYLSYIYLHKRYNAQVDDASYTCSMHLSIDHQVCLKVFIQEKHLVTSLNFTFLRERERKKEKERLSNENIFFRDKRRRQWEANTLLHSIYMAKRKQFSLSLFLSVKNKAPKPSHSAAPH